MKKKRGVYTQDDAMAKKIKDTLLYGRDPTEAMLEAFSQDNKTLDSLHRADSLARVNHPDSVSPDHDKPARTHDERVSRQK